MAGCASSFGCGTSTRAASSPPSVDPLTAACGSTNPGIACRLVWDLTHSTNAANLTRVYLAGPAQLVIRIGFVILITAREWTSQYEWYAHRRLAMQAGLSPEIADAIAEGKRPAAMGPMLAWL